jgi:two-component system chemotaxis response regulator CheB
MYKAVVIGTSAGGLNALDKIFSGLDKNFNLPVMLVQHKHVESDDYLAKYLNKLSHLNFKEAEEKEPIKEGNVYIAPADYHLLVEEDFTLSLNVDEKVHFCRPAIDILFETAAEAYGKHLIGIILTGANEDGAQGMLAIKNAGGLTIAQNPESAEVDFMPRSAINKVNIDYIVDLETIARILNRITK